MKFPHKELQTIKAFLFSLLPLKRVESYNLKEALNKAPAREFRRVKKYGKFYAKQLFYKARRRIRSPFNYLRVKFEARFYPNPYITSFNELMCSEDIVKEASFNTKHKCNVMALWRTYKRLSGVHKAIVSDESRSAYTNNTRMYWFLKYMTKWYVSMEQPRDGVLVNSAFLINPDKKEYQYLLFNLDAEEVLCLSNTQTATQLQKDMIHYSHAASVYSRRKKDLNVIGPHKDVVYMSFTYRLDEDKDDIGEVNG